MRISFFFYAGLLLQVTYLVSKLGRPMSFYLVVTICFSLFAFHYLIDTSSLYMLILYTMYCITVHLLLK